MKLKNYWAQDLDVAAQLSQQYYPHEAQETIALADDICEQKYLFRGHWEMERTNVPVQFENEIEWDTIPAGDPEWVYAFNRLSIFVVLGKAWRYTKKDKYVHAFVKQMTSWLENVPFTEEAKQTTWRSIETGLRCKNILLALNLMWENPLVTDELLQKVEQSLQVHAQWLLEAHGTFQQLSNWGVLQDHGLFLLGTYFENEEWKQIALSRLDEELFYQVLADGTHWEQSPLYHCEVLKCCLDVVLVAKRENIELPPEFSKRTLAMSRALASMLRPNGFLVSQSDSDYVDARDVISLAAVLFEDPDLKTIAGHRLREENMWDFADWENYYSHLPLGDRFKSTMLPASGNVMMRASNSVESDFLHMHNGSLGSGHGHADLLHVDLVSNEQDILVDCGRYTYVDSPMRKFLKSPEGHNTILVDGQWFSEYQDSWSYKKLAQPLKGEYCFTNIADYASGSHLGYCEQGVMPRREVLRLGENLWVLWDTLLGFDENEHRYQNLYHFGIDGAVTLQPEKAMLQYHGTKASAQFAFLGTDAQYNLSKAPFSAEYNKLDECDCLQVDYMGGKFTQFVTVIATGIEHTVPHLQVELLPVFLKSANRELPLETASALKITVEDDEWTIINCHNEIVDAVDMLTANGYYGYGEILVFNKQMPRGICLAW